MKPISVKTFAKEPYWLYRFVDLILPFFILFISMKLYNVNWQDRYVLLGILGGLVFTTSSQMIGLYQASISRSLISSLQLIINAWLLTWAILIILAFLFKDSANFSRAILLIWAILTPVTLILYRALFHKAFKAITSDKSNLRKIAIAGSSLSVEQISTLNQPNSYPTEIIGYYEDTENDHSKLQYIGSLNQIYLDALAHKFDEIYLSLPLNEEEKIKELLNKLADTTVTVKYIPNMFIFDLMHAKWSDINGIPVLSVYDTPLNSLSARLLKRMEDIFLSTIILLLVSPVLLIISIIIKLSSPGPVIFKQKRYGVNGKEINIYKFRSMTAQDNGTIVQQAIKNDARITPFGAFLRKTSLDELPQFVNVIQGKMSIVGPRPHATAHNEQYRKLVPKYMQRHLVKPGITGWAQINGWRGETDTLEKMEKRVEFDLHYINNWSLWFDIKIILMTFIKGFINKNAY